jgi:hypothetical protein
MDVVFLSKLPKIVLGFARVELQMIKIKFCHKINSIVFR